MAPAKGTRAGRRARSMTAVPPLATVRLRLRALTVDDAEAMFPTLSDSSLLTWWSRAPFASIAEVRDYFAPRPDMEGWRCWALSLAGGDRVIGRSEEHTSAPLSLMRYEYANL